MGGFERGCDTEDFGDNEHYGCMRNALFTAIPGICV